MVKFRSSHLLTVFSFTLILFVHSCTSGESDSNTGLSNSITGSTDDNTLISYQADTEPLYDIEFIREVVFDGPGGFLAGRVSVDDSNRVYLSGDRREIQVFEPDGVYIKTLGGTGSGPGEFRADHPLNMEIQGNRMIVYDRMLQRFNIFNLESLSSLDTILMDPTNWAHIQSLENYSIQPGSTVFLEDGTVLVEFVEYDARYLSHEDMQDLGLHLFEKDNLFVKMDLKGQFNHEPVFLRKVKQILQRTERNPGLILDGDFVPTRLAQSMINVTSDGFIFYTDSDNFLIQVYNPDGVYLRAFYHPYVHANIDFETTDRVERHFDYPSNWPAIKFMISDDMDRLWFATITDDDEMLEWWLTDTFGKLLARFIWPGQKHMPLFALEGIKLVKDNYMYVVEPKADETAWPPRHFVKYRLEFTER